MIQGSYLCGGSATIPVGSLEGDPGSLCRSSELGGIEAER